MATHGSTDLGATLRPNPATVAAGANVGNYTTAEFDFAAAGRGGTLITLDRAAATRYPGVGAADGPMPLSLEPAASGSWWVMRG